MSVTNNPKNMQAALIQAIVLRYFEQTYGNDVTIYGEIVNDIDIFSKQVKYLNGDICVFLTNLNDENTDYLETLKNFSIKNILQVIKKCSYSEKTKLKLVIVPTGYIIEEVENLKKCNDLKNKLLSIIKTDEDKADFIKYLFKRNSEESIYNTLLNCVNYWKYVKDSVIKSPELEPDYVNMLFNNFVALDYVILEYEELKKVVKFDQDFIYDLYNKLDILN